MMSSKIRAAALAVLVGTAHAQGAGGGAQQQPSTSPAQPAVSGHVPHTQITPANVADLVPVWAFRTGDLQRRSAETMRRTKFQVTPLLAGDRLLVTRCLRVDRFGQVSGILVPEYSPYVQPL